jgi:hypothetical protein
MVMAKEDEIAHFREEVSILREEVHRLRKAVVESSDIPDGAIHEGEPPIVPNRRLTETTTRTQACCYLSTPEHVRSFVGTLFYIYTDKGQLRRLAVTRSRRSRTGDGSREWQLPVDEMRVVSLNEGDHARRHLERP